MSVVRYSGHRELRMIIAVLDVRVECGGASGFVSFVTNAT